ncbi:MAG: type VI secretion system tip protein VgrG, partial [Syntrophaceae bacterium]
TKSTPNSTGYNELRFEDKAGREEVYLQGEKDWNILIKNDKGQEIGHDETLHVANDRTKNVDGDQKETIGRNKKEEVILDSTETVGVAKFLSTGGLYQVTVGAAMNETVIGAKTEQVGVVKAVFVGANMTEKVAGDRSSSTNGSHKINAKTISLVADDEITFTTGSATMTMKSSGDIILSGNNIQVRGTGDVNIKGQNISEN